jgi:hypothetical protein
VKPPSSPLLATMKFWVALTTVRFWATLGPVGPDGPVGP